MTVCYGCGSGVGGRAQTSREHCNYLRIEDTLKRPPRHPLVTLDRKNKPIESMSITRDLAQTIAL